LPSAYFDSTALDFSLRNRLRCIFSGVLICWEALRSFLTAFVLLALFPVFISVSPHAADS
jgi:hypothetical protein